MTIEDLGGDQLRKLLSDTINPQGENAARRRECRQRVKIMEDMFDDEIVARIAQTFHEEAVVAEVANWAMSIFNPMKRAVRRIAVGYKLRPKRRIEKANKGDSKKWARLLRNLHFDTQAKTFHQYAVALNTVVTLARRREINDEPTIGFELVTGATAEVIQEPDAPSTAPPGILAYLVPSPEIGVAPSVVTVDSRWYIMWDHMGRDLAVASHDMGRFPGATLRNNEPLHQGDFWNPWPGRAAKQATFECGLIGATMGWTRKTQCRNLIALFLKGEPDQAEVPDGQVAHPERPIIGRGDVQFVVHDLSVAVDKFIEHMKALQDEAVEVLTGAVSTFSDPDPANPIQGQAAVHQHAALDEIREDQLSRLEAYDRDMMKVIARLADDIDMEDAIDPDLVEEGIVVEFPKLPFLDSPMERLKLQQERTRFGTGNQVTALMEELGVSEEEAMDRLIDIAEQRVKLDALRASRNNPTDPNDPGTTLPDDANPGEGQEQVQGRAGGSTPKDEQSAA